MAKGIKEEQKKIYQQESDELIKKAKEYTSPRGGKGYDRSDGQLNKYIHLLNEIKENLIAGDGKSISSLIKDYRGSNYTLQTLERLNITLRKEGKGTIWIDSSREPDKDMVLEVLSENNKIQSEYRESKKEKETVQADERKEEVTKNLPAPDRFGDESFDIVLTPKRIDQYLDFMIFIKKSLKVNPNYPISSAISSYEGIDNSTRQALFDAKFIDELPNGSIDWIRKGFEPNRHMAVELIKQLYHNNRIYQRDYKERLKQEKEDLKQAKVNAREADALLKARHELHLKNHNAGLNVVKVDETVDLEEIAENVTRSKEKMEEEMAKKLTKKLTKKIKKELRKKMEKKMMKIFMKKMFGF